MSLAAGAVAAVPTAEPATAANTTLTLSMKVEPGQPVPMELVRAQTASQFGERPGAGVDVAIIDSGVSPVAGLDQPGKLLYGPDLSNEGGHQNLANLDTYGHGTHMAGIIAGDDGDQVLGIAPESRLVSLKVAGATGETDIAQVIAAIEWVVEHQNDNGLNIRVLNLSLGLPTTASHVGDPLAAAVERAWRAGIVVVVSAGNRGNDIGSVDSPAISPYVLATGAIDSYESWGEADSLADFSSGGNGDRNPDVLAAGRSIQSFRVPGSMLDQMHPTARVGERYFRGSGTSQSAAVMSGIAAALISEAPQLTPDQVKFLLAAPATDVVPGTIYDGHGKVNPAATASYIDKATKAPTQKYVSAWSGFKLDRRALRAMADGSWTGGEWNGASWAGGEWSGASWAGASWAGASWAGGEWAGASWAGASWAGASWAGASWAGASWAGASWAGASWAGASWAGASWAGASWAEEVGE